MDKGAHFYKCDFQVHSPRDINWKGNGASTPEQRQQYAEEFVRACRDKELTAVAITDHHDLTFYSFIKRAAEAETDQGGRPLPKEQQLVVFPGMELTLGVPCQAILILDADFPEAFLSQVPGLLAVTQTPATDEKHCQISRREDITSLVQLHELLDRHDFIRGRYIILPNVGENGQFSIMRSGFAAKYKEMPCVGGYVDGSIGKLSKGNLDRLNGVAKEWGNKRVSIFQTSDNRHRSFELLGKHYTWVKWAVPTTEALRQACLAQESRISQEEPGLPRLFITDIQVSNSKFLGPVDVKLNSQYNAFIGGRGTGKSTLLEYLRWALADQTIEIGEDDLPAFQQKRRSLIEKTLLKFEAVVSVGFSLNGTPHIVRRSTKTNEISIKVDGNEFRTCTEAEIRNLFPVRAYSQKQLSNVGVKNEELVRFIEAPIQKELIVVQERMRLVGSELRKAYETLQSKRSLEKEVEKYNLELQSLNSQIENLRKSLTGVSKEDEKIISQQALIEKEDELIKNWAGELKSLKESVASLTNQVDRSKFDSEVTPDSPNASALIGIRSVLKDVHEEVKTLSGSLSGLFNKDSPSYKIGEIRAHIEEWTKKKQDHEKLYEAAKNRSSAHQGTLTQMTATETRQRQLSTDLAERKHQLNSLGNPDDNYSQHRSEWKQLLSDRTNLLQTECTKLTTLSNNYIKATLVRAGGNQHIQEALLEVVKGAKIQGEKIETLFSSIEKATDPLSDWFTLVEEFEQLALANPGQGTEIKLPHTPILDRANLTEEQKKRMVQRLTLDAWLELSLSDLQDIPSFEYRVRENEYIRFEDASAGQQATALMYVLLNQEGPPLVIDQPEDDLDSLVITDIIKELWEAKKRRQLIFASHNANLVVNGDAELVVCCDYTNQGDQTMGTIKECGAIDLPGIKEKITSIMEGGKDAFKLRKEKYGF